MTSLSIARTLRAVSTFAFLALGVLAGTMQGTPAQAQVSVNLRDADIRSFVEIVSEATGQRFVIDPGVRGTVTVLAPGEMTPQELYEVFLSVLEVNRLTVVEGGAVDRIVPMNTARELGTGGGAAERADGDFETRVIPVRNAPVQSIVEVVRPLLPPEAVLSPVPGSRLLVLSDRGQNFRRISALIEQLDQAQAPPIQMIRLRNANAAEVMQVIESMNVLPEGSSISADRRSNALVVSAPDDVRERVRILAARLDTQSNNVVSRAVALNYADAPTLATVVLQAIQADGAANSTPARIVPEPQTNSLLVSAPQEQMGDILNMIAYLDQRPRQVLVEAVIFEMSISSYSDLAVQWGGILNNAAVGGATFNIGTRPSLTSLVSSVLNGDVADPGSGGFVGGLAGDQNDGVAGLLTAIASQQSTRLLSTPSIMTLNNQEAEIVVAQNVPFVTGSYSTVSDSAVENPFQTIERQDVGLTLNVTPQINADRTVKMTIAQEVSNLTSSQSSAGGEITAKRALTTTVLVQDGNVIMLGGLLENGSGSTNQRVPGLSRLPLVGGLFRGKSTDSDQRVLLVLLRPQVVSSEQEGQRVSRQIAAKAREASAAIAPLPDTRFPASSSPALPFNGADLNQPFDAGFVDDLAQTADYPPLPSRLRFSGN
ncbi:type II secretion system secretin GspD [Maritimibacter alkaliphilus]|nr:type II secretion system secretin GspD [Maritimibacter alkaliphilus]